VLSVRTLRKFVCECREVQTYVTENFSLTLLPAKKEKRDITFWAALVELYRQFRFTGYLIVYWISFMHKVSDLVMIVIPFLGTFVAVSCLSSCPSFLSQGTAWLPQEGFS